MNWTIDNFPTLRDFCRDHDIEFKFVVEPVFDEMFHGVMRDNILKFIFNKDCSGYTVIHSETQLVSLWLPDWETELIKKLKNKFNIYDSAVAERIARHNIEFWGKFNKPLEEKVYTPNFKYDNAFLSKPWFPYGEYNKTVKLHDEGKDDKMKRKESIAMRKCIGTFQMIGIKKVIFNDPATIIIWTDDVKTIIKAQNEPYDPEKGMAMAIAKRALGNEGNYYDIFKKWIPKKDKTTAMKEMAEKLSYMLLDPKVTRYEIESAVKDSMKMMDSFKEPEAFGKVTNVTDTDDGLVIKAKITDEGKSNIQKVFGMTEEDVIDHVCKGQCDTFF